MAGCLTAGPVLELAQAARSPSGAAGWTLDHLLADVAAALLMVACTGLAAMSALAVTAAVAARRWPTLAAACSHLTPQLCRQIVATALGLGLAAPSLVDGPALATHPGPAHGCRETCRHIHHVHRDHRGLAGLGFPDLPDATTSRPPPRLHARQVVVREGDSLWRLAERRLPPHAAMGDVAALTWRLYARNRSTVGDDPDLIYPGMTLITPEGSS
jgi:hypothetical protein